MSNFEKFTNQYSVSKTIRFRLKPCQETLKNIKEKNCLIKDEEIAKKYKKAKKIIDGYHKELISKTLDSFNFEENDFEEFSTIYSNHKKDKKNEDLKKSLKNKQTELRKKIKNCFDTKELFSKEFIQKTLPQWLEDKINLEIAGIENPKEIINFFKKWTTYFTGFNENRKNIYTEEDKSTSIGHRLIHENLPDSIKNIERYHQAKELGVDFSEVEENFKEDLKSDSLDDVFKISYFNKCLNQTGIDLYNQLRGGMSEKEGQKKQGINEKINLYSQQLAHEKTKVSDEDQKQYEQKKKKVLSCQISKLKKQILSDRSTNSFLYEEISSDKDLCQAIDSLFFLNEKEELVGFIEELNHKINFNITESAKKIFNLLKEADSENIYIKNQSLWQFSKTIFGNADFIKEALEAYVETKVYPVSQGKKETKTLLNQREKYRKQPYLSFHIIHEALEHRFSEGETSEELAKKAHQKPLFNYFKWNGNLGNRNLQKYLDEIKTTYKEVKDVLKKHSDEEKIKLDKNEIPLIKNYLDALKDFQDFLKPLHLKKNEDEKKVEVYEKDNAFYSDFDDLYEVISLIIPLYNQSRNYLTKKPYRTEKYKLNFENETLALGWAKSKETDNTSLIFIKDNQYYLGIMDKEENKIFFEKSFQSLLKEKEKEKKCYQKMDYHFLPEPYKTLPRVFFSEKGLDVYSPSEEIHRIRNHSTYTKNGKPRKGFNKEDFNKEDLNKMIDFYKQSLKKHPEWGIYDFDLKPKIYNDVNEFYQEISDAGFKIIFKDIPESYINDCVKEGKLYLFQIYSKDFSPKSTGRPNLQTLYWRALFDEENLKNVIYKLNGQAELFYRKASIPYEKDIWEKGHHSNDPKKKQKHPIIKDRRYAVDTFLFNVSISCNFKAKNDSKINQKVQDYIKENKEINLIGIDRGERHLAYYNVINQKGEVLKDKEGHYLKGSLNNPLGNKDYQKLLDEKGKERDAARKNWDTIEKIKDLKAGYLSQVVHKITSLMIEHNAMIVFEDLNFGFKRGRFKIEKQVYQKLEKMLIDKLNFLVFKNKKPQEIGGYLKALQLTAPFKSFEKLGKQSGFIFYVSAYHTSKVCPSTGFVNLLYPKYETVKKAQGFFQKFKKICFNKKEDYFEFHLDYSDFTTKAEGLKKEWVVCSDGDRLIDFRNSEKNNQWDTKIVSPTKNLKSLFQKYHLDFENGLCLKDLIYKKTEKDFFENLIKSLRHTLQMRNSKIGEEEDYLISPVKDENGSFFDSRKSDESLPQNADDNGAYHIALKGLLFIKQMRKTEKADLSNKAWYEFIQDKKNNI